MGIEIAARDQELVGRRSGKVYIEYQPGCNTETHYEPVQRVWRGYDKIELKCPYFHHLYGIVLLPLPDLVILLL